MYFNNYVIRPKVKFPSNFFEIRDKNKNSTYVRIFVSERKKYHEKQNHCIEFCTYVMEESEIRSIKFFSFFFLLFLKYFNMFPWKLYLWMDHIL